MYFRQAFFDELTKLAVKFHSDKMRDESGISSKLWGKLDAIREKRLGAQPRPSAKLPRKTIDMSRVKGGRVRWSTRKKALVGLGTAAAAGGLAYGGYKLMKARRDKNKARK